MSVLDVFIVNLCFKSFVLNFTKLYFAVLKVKAEGVNVTFESAIHIRWFWTKVV